MATGESDRSDVTRVLTGIQRGEPQAAHELLPLVYEELRRLAAHRLMDERPGYTLQPTALVHEAYLRVVGPNPDLHWECRGHFFAAAAAAMRRILLDRARDQKRLKRGGTRRRELLDLDALLSEAAAPDDLLDFDEALNALEQMDPRGAQLVKLRAYAGLTLDEAAAALGVVARTAQRDWAFARAWLYHKLVPRESC
jgi:RNA polymerase sigma factor (TIGR02999 family)